MGGVLQAMSECLYRSFTPEQPDNNIIRAIEELEDSLEIKFKLLKQCC